MRNTRSSDYNNVMGKINIMKYILIPILLFLSSISFGQINPIEDINSDKIQSLNNIKFINGKELTTEESLMLLDYYMQDTISSETSHKEFPYNYLNKVFDKYMSLPKKEKVKIRFKAELSTKFFFNENYNIDLIVYNWIDYSPFVRNRKKQKYINSFVDIVSKNKPERGDIEEPHYGNLIHTFNLDLKPISR